MNMRLFIYGTFIVIIFLCIRAFMHSMYIRSMQKEWRLPQSPIPYIYRPFETVGWWNGHISQPLLHINSIYDAPTRYDAKQVCNVGWWGSL
jgi:hypothetical protein